MSRATADGTPARVGGAVLAGGASTRMGRDKALLRVGGSTLVERTVGVLAASGAEPIIVVGGADRGSGVMHIPDQFPGAGPLGGILTALGALANEYVLIVACDLPALDVATTSALVEAAVGHDAAMARTDRLEPLCAVWGQTCVDALRDAFERGERAPVRALGELDVVTVAVPPSVLVNLNTPEDLTSFGQAGN